MHKLLFLFLAFFVVASIFSTLHLGEAEIVTPLTSPNGVLVILYKNGTYFENVTWESILWGQVDKVGILKKDIGRVGFEVNYGSVLWYPIDYDKPIMFIAQSFYGKVNSNWYNFSIQGNVTKTPWISQTSGSINIGWTGTISYLGYNFPVSIGVKTNSSDSVYFKTNITTPINLTNSGIEYDLYANPLYLNDIEHHANYVRLYYQNGTNKDFMINGTNLDLTYSLPNAVSNIGILINSTGELTLSPTTSEIGTVYL